MSNTARTILTAMAIAVATVAEAAPLPGFVLTAETEHFSFYSRDKQSVDAARAEQFLLRMQQALGQQISGRAEYYRYSTPEQIAVGTGTWAQGVTFPEQAQIHSTQAFHAHEIVHLVAGSMGKPGAFFQEGLAVALGNEGRWNGQSVDSLAKASLRSGRVSALLAGFERFDVQVAFPIAGSFVKALIEGHGLPTFARFLRACDGTNTEAAFAEVYGQSLDAAGAAWFARL